MGKVLTSGGGGGGTGSDDCTASKAQVLAGYTAVTRDSGDEAAAGSMPNNGGQSGTLNCGQSKVIPAGYTSGGTVTANSLASQTGGVTAEDKYVYIGKTYWKDGVKRTGSMTAASVLSFSVAAYSTSQVLATWMNPATGPFSGVIICAKTGGYPANMNDGRVYTGVGSNSAANGTSSVIIGGFAAGIVYYFRIWSYVTCSAGDFYSGYLQAAATPTAHGRKAFTSSGTFTVPAGVRSINIHCTGGGSSGWGNSSRKRSGARGGCGGYTAYKNSIAVSPGQNVAVVVGAGGVAPAVGNYTNGNDSYASLNGSMLVSASGGTANVGGSGGGHNGIYIKEGMYNAGDGGSDGSDGVAKSSSLSDSEHNGLGQGITTREFGAPNGTLYAGGGGGGGCAINIASGSGGAGGGGAGASGPYVAGNAGSAGTGGGGGGQYDGYSIPGGSGGSGNVIITW